MRRSAFTVLLFLCALFFARDAARGEEGETLGAIDITGDVTIVTSDRLTYDAGHHQAVFERNVVVTDPQLQLTADKLTLFFDEEGQARRIEAVGKVHITHEITKAVAGAATYDVGTGKIELTGKPRVTRGRDILQGDKITFWRDHNRLVCEPQARLVIYPQEGAREQLLGE